MRYHGVTWENHPGYMREQQELVAEMAQMVSEWCKREDQLERAKSRREQPRTTFSTRREQARAQASILHVMRGQYFAATLEEIIGELVDASPECLWLPSVRDGRTGYLGELTRLMRLYAPLGSVERLELVPGTPDRWRWHGFEPWRLK